MGTFEFCENIVEREYENFQEANALNSAALTRFGSTLLLCIMLIRNKRRVAKAFESGNVGIGMRYLILPSYYDYVVALILTSFVYGLFSLLGGSLRELPVVAAVQGGVNHMFREGLAFFLMQYGAGYYAMRRAAFYAVLWGAICFVVLLLVYRLKEKGDRMSKLSLFGNMFFCIFVLLFYCVITFSPVERVYRRPALKLFAMFQICDMSLWILIVVFLYMEFDVAYCIMFTTRTILEGVVEQIVVFYVLCLDSEFWQGISGQLDNPLAGIWDLELDTAAAMGQQLSVVEKNSRKLPIIHFGMITLDQHLGYVAGGLSRVYFGSIKKEPVAIKILFAMELTPKVVKSFYEEVQVLYELQHENVVRCIGVSVMPPAVCVVLEHCKHGSLFDYLHKPRKVPVHSPSRQQFVGKSLDGDAHTELSDISALHRNRSHSGSSRKSSVDEQGKQGSQSNKPVSSPLHHPFTQSRPHHMRGSSGNPANLEDLASEFRRSETTSISSRASFTYNDRVKALFLGRNESLSPVADSPVPDTTQDRKSFFADRFSIGERESSKYLPRNSSLTTSSKRRPSHIESKPTFSMVEKFRMIIDASTGLAFLHERGYMHCDIKSPNFLVSNEKVVKLADLGEARALDSCAQFARLPNPAINWKAPELLTPNMSMRSYTPASDVYGLAMVISEIILQEIPLDELLRSSSPEQCYHYLVNENCRPILPDSIPLAFRNILTLAWNSDPDSRPTCADIANTAQECLQKMLAESIPQRV